MAKEILENNPAFTKALRDLIREYKPQKQVNYKVLTDKLVTPFKLDADQMDQLIGSI